MVDSTAIKNFLQKESAGGILLMITAALAIIIANSPLQEYYNLLIDIVVAISIGDFSISKPLLLWVNDGLMAVFFLLIGLELKREFLEGELSDRNNIILPGLGAIGGMAGPAAIYLLLNWEDPVAVKGWAIPAATDIAFALAVLSLLGPRVPTSLKIFLTSLAIFDDLGAILIIAFFYTSHISGMALVVVAACVLILFYLNSRGVCDKSPYLLIGTVMWVAMLKSGVHATLTGVILAMFIPNQAPADQGISPLKSLEHDLHSAVAFIILPVFAFCNSGVNLSGVGMEQLLHGVPLGIALGLLIGKQLGVLGLCWLGVKMNLTQLPNDISWGSLYGVALLSGIGFTMSLFIGSLAFEETGVNLLFDERLGIIIGSLLSGVLGYLVLRSQIKSG
ncbi:MAG: Na+/H+ antiporter NhaA [Thiotrichales bacterium]|nr:Na+/H+ antiporter NhaA [Thiotrichales bacterium]